MLTPFLPRVDVLVNRKLLGKLLSICGGGVQSVEFAEDGAVALDTVAMHRDIDQFQLILLDNIMPNMVRGVCLCNRTCIAKLTSFQCLPNYQSGIECAAELRRRGYRQTIVALTGNSFGDELSAFARAGADLVLVKPLTLPQLRGILAFLRRCGSARRPGEKLRLTAGEAANEEVQVVPEELYYAEGRNVT
jgi:CheY-like chemotaxis protein